ncbi:LPXTG cell wall anchor domain-containing protein [Streptomyces brasiliensis]|uniref:LPXTG cell wall anchor domain-containing protein n=1 Tax=Streptomyces brasiliensis TaxID=1954 RepID=A0A917KPA4_9ACTN|nr:LPXTG cell wall anchor domain-containing protein [Streptomyces brasiliensis]GGJ20029.1 hypothetical protein GCM10010121_033740 [Streptomyces brasiliensis]
MKLRRAMATAAATAVIAPLALLSAPAAFADGDESPSTSISSPAAEESTPAAEDSTPAAEDSTPAAEDSTPAAEDSTPASQSPSTSPSASTSVSATPSTTPSQSATPTGEPSEWPDDCPLGEDGVDPESQLSIAVSGLPGKIVAGSGWHNFKLTAANHSDKSLGTVQWLAVVDNYAESDNEKDWLSTYARLEFFNPKTQAWESLADEIGNGVYFGETPLGPKETVDIKLRLDITAKAPAGDGFSLGLGGYVDAEKNCVHSAFGFYEFTVLAPGSSNENPGEAKPGKGDKPDSGKKPQGGAEELPATGSLASTGSSSALPTIGLVGGVAVVAGAGAVFVVRRRKAGTTV